jgi:RND superfamily putative drug exporter
MTEADTASPSPLSADERRGDTRGDEPSSRPRRGLAIPLVLAMLLLGLAGMSFQPKLGEVQKNDNAAYLPDSAESTQVADLAEQFNDGETIPGFVVYQRDSGLTDEDRAKIEGDAAAFAKLEGVAADQVGRPQFSEDGQTASISVPLAATVDGESLDGDVLTENENAIIDLAEKDAPEGLEVYPAGPGGILSALIEAFAGIDGILLVAALGVVIVILLIVYRSPVLWILPLTGAILALGLSTMLVYFLADAEVITLSGQSAGILSVLVIGAGTDYALLIISRYREELYAHESRWAAMAAALRGAIPPIVASAATVCVGLLCLLVSELNSNRSLGPVLAIGVACTLLVMLTFLPAALVLLGKWIFWPRIPHVDAEAEAGVHRFWNRVAEGIGRRARLGWVVSTVVLLVLCLGFLQLEDDGLADIDTFSNSPSVVQGQELYSAKFDKGAGAPVVIALNADRLDEVTAAVEGVEGIEQRPGAVCLQPDFGKLAELLASGAQPPAEAAGCLPAELSVQPRDGRTLLNATLAHDYDSEEAYETVNRVREAVRAVPGADALVGGQSASNYDVLQASARDRNVIIPIVLLVIIVILGVLLRSIVAPLLLVATVVLSFGATLGVSALMFNHVFGFAGSDPTFVLFSFVFLVALGIDYNIFLMTRIREEALQHGTRSGALRGLAVTGGVITSAGIVLASTFAVLGVLPLVFLAQIGFAVAFGVLLDTMLVRSVLVPALTHDLGRVIWWPSALSKREP